ncbi:MAG: hypothetical protein K0R75_3020, partial [Paenibacillaceae bacterium]|nr:hypothetical protein [Paenibacillaceae bacterium]
SHKKHPAGVGRKQGGLFSRGLRLFFQGVVREERRSSPDSRSWDKLEASKEIAAIMQEFSAFSGTFRKNLHLCRFFEHFEGNL